MLILASTTDKIQLTRDSTADVDVHATYIDCSDASPPVVDAPNKQNSAFNTAATGDIVAAPGSNKRRNVKTLHIRNKHASASVKVTVIYDQNGTDFELHSATLLAGESLEYVEGIGWFTLEAPDVANPVTVKRLGSDQSNSTTTPTEVTGLTLATGTGTFLFEYFLILQSGATTTGHKLSCNYDGSESSFVYDIMWLTAATTASDDVIDQDHVAAPGGVFSGFSARAGTTAGTGATTDVDTANADVFYYVFGIMVVTVAGNLELWHGSDAAAASTVKAGSSLRLTQTA